MTRDEASKKFEKVYSVLEHELKAINKICSIFVCPVELDLSARGNLVPETPKELDWSTEVTLHIKIKGDKL